MKTSALRISFLILIFSFLYIFSLPSFAQTTTKITIREALDSVFDQDTGYALFVWEQDLAEQRIRLKRQPKIAVEMKPATISDGKWQDPVGILSMSMQLLDNIGVGGSFILAMDQSAFALLPSATLTLDYHLLAPFERTESELPSLEDSLVQSNALVKQTVDLYIHLKQKLDLQAHARKQQRYLEDSLEAALEINGFDVLELKKEIRNQREFLAELEKEVSQLNFEFSNLLGTVNSLNYEPWFDVRDVAENLIYRDSFSEVLAFNSGFRQAQANSILALEQLEREQKTRGWDVHAQGGIGFKHDSNSKLEWSIGFSASKALYPRQIVVGELELALAKAEHVVEVQKGSLFASWQAALQTVDSYSRRVEVLAEHCAEAKEDWAYRNRQYDAGLVTELQVEKAALVWEKAKLDWIHSQMAYAQSVLSLWDLAGRDLRQAAFDLFN